ncbi:1-phosphofructokinase family hexose kinase [Actinoallomurus rhizosphaericola]|uniref:1-phosphofructokinase family hexose kinase n=1 Tax=Actinoallomurus rhizosphaericola TaxID=2952536 RepID=UPI002092392D|nr:1-phosphofructokinase family hexose kinase [Actinoallomurus rhizosphaericola]MCO6000081.1 1-phosphofructokinase family hexose kinase [Actinoallomurus rhizosphaericola]
MIVTVTPNPSVDRTLTVERMTHGDVLRATSSWSEPSGKGVNVSLALRGHGYATQAVIPIGGAEGARLEAMLRAAGLDYVPVPIDGEIRSNVSVLEPDGTVTKVNEPGPELSEAELKALIDAVAVIGERAEWIVGCGSLPVGTPAGFYADMVAAARGTSARIAVDSSGPSLTAVLAAGPDLIKPNAAELAEAAGRPVETLGDALTAARVLQDRGAKSVLASLGPDGAVLVEGGDAVHGEAYVAETRSTVGAGDALLAGFLAAGGHGPEALRSALGWSAAAVRQPGTVLRADGTGTTAEVILHDRIDVGRRLRHS